MTSPAAEVVELLHGVVELQQERSVGATVRQHHTRVHTVRPEQQLRVFVCGGSYLKIAVVVSVQYVPTLIVVENTCMDWCSV